jgi:Ca-activated chloride channel homolog
MQLDTPIAGGGTTMSDHSGPQPSQPAGRRHRRRRSRAWVVGGAAAATGALIVGVGGVALARLGDSGDSGDSAPCAAGTRTLDVVAAPEIAPVVEQVARRAFPAQGRDAACVRAAVVARDGATVAQALPQDPAAAPDVWIPDSSAWARQAAKGALGTEDASIARSPVVLALPQKAAARRGWPARRLDFAAVLSDVAPHQATRLGLPDLRRSAPTVGALVGLQAASQGKRDGRAALAAALHGAVPGLPTEPEQLLASLGNGALGAVPTSEQAVWAYNAGRSAAVVAAYPASGATTLDYPYLVITTTASARADAERLLTALKGNAGQDRLRARGFRAADGSAGVTLTQDGGVDRQAPATTGAPAPATASAAVKTVELLNLGTRLLAVIDVSGSMGEKVPGARGATRLGLTKDAAARGLALYDDDSQIGLWVFSTDLTSRTDFRQVVPITSLGARTADGTGRATLGRALAGVRHIVGGSTGLYDTALAAVRSVRSGWDPKRVNAVLLLSDGRNEDERGISLATLLTTLRQENDPRRPIPVITISYGPDSDAAALGAISKATGGATYLARDPRQIQQVFLDAIGRRPCRPDC